MPTKILDLGGCLLIKKIYIYIQELKDQIQKVQGVWTKKKPLKYYFLLGKKEKAKIESERGKKTRKMRKSNQKKGKIKNQSMVYDAQKNIIIIKQQSMCTILDSGTSLGRMLN